MIICVCNGINEESISTAIKNGCGDFRMYLKRRCLTLHCKMCYRVAEKLFDTVKDKLDK